MSEPHAIARARERYGIEMTMAELRALERQCARGGGPDAVLLARLPEGTLKMLVRHAGHALLTVFDPATGRIVTFLARDMTWKSKRWEHIHRHRDGRSGRGRRKGGRYDQEEIWS